MNANERYYEAPKYYEPKPGDPAAVFLVGGITGCYDWQMVAGVWLLDAGFIVLNPRRAGFPMGDPGAAGAQIAWEQHHLHLPDVVTLAWFPPCEARVTVQPIALLELGQALENDNRALHVGASGGYPRHQDVVLQTAFNRPEILVHAALQDVLTEVREGWAEWRR